MTEVKAKSHTGGTKKTIKITQIGSIIGRQQYQRKTLVGLGLGRIGRTSEVVDTPAIRGMIQSVKHLLRVEEK